MIVGQLMLGRALLVLAFAAAGVIASPVSPAAANADAGTNNAGTNSAGTNSAGTNSAGTNSAGTNSAGTNASTNHGGKTLRAILTGAAEVPGPGDADGIGAARITIVPAAKRLCYKIAVANLDGAVTAAHIHRAPVAAAGPIVVDLKPPVRGAVAACTAVAKRLARDLLDDPDEFYVNVHTTVFPAGAVRGQLHR